MKLHIGIKPNTYKEEDGFLSCLGKIFIGDDFWETIIPALNYWTTDEYEKQWKEGLERIKTHPISCLVASVQHPRKTPPLINWWILYKVGEKIYIQNHLLNDTTYREHIGNQQFTPQTCYNFIKPRKTKTDDGFKYAEWVIGL